jgi:type IV pilus assembly protein PilE
MRQSGFTLVELLAAMAVAGILTSVALPSYLDSVRKARRAEAFDALIKAQLAQERFRADSASFGPMFVNAAATGFAVAASATVGAVRSFDSAGGHYAVSVVEGSPSASGYTLLAHARPGSPQASDAGCQCLQLRMSGGQLSQAAGGTGGVFSGRASDCGALSTGAAAQRCWAR